MNSKASSDQKVQESRSAVAREKPSTSRTDDDGSHASTSGFSNDCIPIVVGNIPLYLSRSEDGAPLYIRQHPPQIDELLQSSSNEGSPHFEGFSDASGSTFDGFSEASSSTFDGFSEVSCSSSNSCASLFCGFADDIQEIKAKTGAVSPQVLNNNSDSEDFRGFSLDDVGSHGEGAWVKSSTWKKHLTGLSSQPMESSPTTASTKRKRKHLGEAASLTKKLKATVNVDDSKSSVRTEALQQYSKEKPVEGLSTRTRSNMLRGSESSCESLPGRVIRRKSVEDGGGSSSRSDVVDADNYIGEYCNSVGCTVKFLDSMKVRKINVNFGMVYELYEFAKKICWRKEYVARWIQRLSGVSKGDPSDEDMQKIHTVLRRRKALTVTLAGRKSSDKKLKSFDKTEFILPSSVKIRFDSIKDKENAVINNAPSITDDKSDVKENSVTGTIQDTGEEICKGSLEIIDGGDENIDLKEEVKVEDISVTDDDDGGDTPSELVKRGLREETKRHSSENVDSAKDMRTSGSEKSPLEDKGVKENESQTKDSVAYSVEIARTGETNSSRQKESNAKKNPMQSRLNPTVSLKQLKLGTKYAEKQSETIVLSNENVLVKRDTEQDTTDRRTSKQGKTVSKEAEKEIQGAEEQVTGETKVTVASKDGLVGEKVNEGVKDKVPLGQDIISGKKSAKRIRKETQRVTEENGKLETAEQGDREEKRSSDLGVKMRESSRQDRINGKETQKKTQKTSEQEVDEMKDSVMLSDKDVMRKESTKKGVKDKRPSKGGKNVRKEAAVRIQKELPETAKQDTDEAKETVAQKDEQVNKNVEHGKNRKRSKQSAIAGKAKKQAQEEVQETLETEELVEGKTEQSIKNTGVLKQGKIHGKEAIPVTVIQEAVGKLRPSELCVKDVQGKDKKKQDMSDTRTSRRTARKMTDDCENEETKTSLQKSALKHSVPVQEKDSKVPAKGTCDATLTAKQDKRLSKGSMKKFVNVKKKSKEIDANEIKKLHKINSADTTSEKPQNINETSNEDYAKVKADDDREENTDKIDCESVDSKEQKKGQNQELDEGEDDFEILKKDREVGQTERRESQMEENVEPMTKKSVSPRGKQTLTSNSVGNDGTENSPGNVTTDSAKTPAGTLGISKSGRLRKASAKGIQSIEIKCLFMESNVPVTVAAKQTSCSDAQRKIISKRKVESEDNSLPVAESKATRLYRRNDSQLLSFTLVDNHLVPNFKELEYDLGPYCAKAGLKVEDLNSDSQIDCEMTNGMIQELHDFYVSRGAPKTSLAIRLFKLTNIPIQDYGHLLSTVVRITKVATIPSRNHFKLQREFRMPKRESMIDISPDQMKNLPMTVPKTPRRPVKKDILEPKYRFTPANSDGKRIRPTRPKKKVPPSKLADESSSDKKVLDDEILQTKGKEGCITRGDIYCLYTKWLKDKMAVGGNVFVTDLLSDVEKLMAERKVTTIRVPAGTLMSSSVKLLDEYKEMLMFSKEDALMYLEEDWLEDIQYLLSKSKTRRNTIDGDSNSRIDGDSSPSHPGSGSVKSDSEINEKVGEARNIHKSNVRKLSKTVDKDPDWSGNDEETSTGKKKNKPQNAKSNTSPKHMDSIGKRAKNKSIAESLKKFDKDINLEIDRTEKGKEIEEEVRKPEKVTKRRLYSFPKVDYDVEKILNYKEVHFKDKTVRLCYLVRWLGFGPEEDSWVNEEDLQCEDLVKEFWVSRKKPKGPYSKTFNRGKSSPSTDDSKNETVSPSKTSKVSEKPQNHKTLGSPEKSLSHKSPQFPKSTKSDSPNSIMKDPDENVDNIIHAMLQCTSPGSNTDKEPEKASKAVTRRQLLDIYDSWREENQSVLMAGDSHSINLEVLVARVKQLMDSRDITTFHPESLLNACFMMTLMRTRLKSKKALDMFLDGSCIEVLRASHMQHVKREYCNIDKTADMESQKKDAVLKLQSDIQSLKNDFASIRHHRNIDQCKVVALEDELNSLQKALTVSHDQFANKLKVLQDELNNVKGDMKTLDLKNSGMGSFSKKSEENDVTDSSLVKRSTEEEVAQALVQLGVMKNRVEGIRKIVTRGFSQLSS